MNIFKSKMEDSQKQEIIYMGEQLQLILGNDNDARKVAEDNIKKIRENEPDKYVMYLSTLICDATVDLQIKSLSAVILRRTILSV